MKKISLAVMFAVLMFCLFCGSAFAAPPTQGPLETQTPATDPAPTATSTAGSESQAEEVLAPQTSSATSQIALSPGTSAAGKGNSEAQPASDLPLYIMLIAMFVILLLMGVFMIIRLNVIAKLVMPREEHAGRPDSMKQQLYKFMKFTDSALETLNENIKTILKKLEYTDVKPAGPVQNSVKSADPVQNPEHEKQQTKRILTSEEILCKLAGDYSTMSVWSQWKSNFEQNNFGIELINDRRPDIGYIPVEWSSAPGLAAVWDNSKVKSKVFLIPSCNTSRLTHPIIQDCYTIHPKDAPIQSAGYRVIRPALAKLENGIYVLVQKGHIERN